MTFLITLQHYTPDPVKDISLSFIQSLFLDPK